MTSTYEIRRIQGPNDPCIEGQLFYLQQLQRTLNPDINKDFSIFWFGAAVVNSHVFIAIEQENMQQPIGMATLVPIYKTLGFEGHIEDVVVLEVRRGRGIAKALMTHLLAYAKELGMAAVSLTSNPDNLERAAAIKLYKKLGFEPANGLMRLKL